MGASWPYRNWLFVAAFLGQMGKMLACYSALKMSARI